MRWPCQAVIRSPAEDIRLGAVDGAPAKAPDNRRRLTAVTRGTEVGTAVPTDPARRQTPRLLPLPPAPRRGRPLRPPLVP